MSSRTFLIGIYTLSTNANYSEYGNTAFQDVDISSQNDLELSALSDPCGYPLFCISQHLFMPRLIENLVMETVIEL